MMTDAGKPRNLMDLITFPEVVAFIQVVFVDLVLAGDNAIVVGVAVASLPLEQRARVMIIGIAAATLMRVGFAAITVQLLQLIGLLLAGGLLLLWVCWKLWRELRELRRMRLAAQRADGSPSASTAIQPKTMRQAILQIVIADISMSLDNVLAVAGVAREHAWVLVFGLVLSVACMGFAAVFIARLLDRYHWVAYLGLGVIVYVSLSMIWDGVWEIAQASGTLT
jgi:YjbE family integral membrane protein